MNIKKIIPVIALSIFAASAVPASADVLGGWSEEGGYFTNPATELNNSFVVGEKGTVSALAAAASHSSFYDYKKPGSQIYERINGETTWKGIEHYSRARYETWVTGTAEADSGRVWGVGYTLATSGWHPGDFATAKTYYGN
ncbi:MULTISPECIES: hypothetical protein [unclassified Psychrobacillus]|uniref:hypothetical protein n=1 Tax=unclassified Psychrobacillus TaxID=2636677 RepID=UPI0030F4B8B0